MMPMLYVLLIIIAIRSITLPGAGSGLEFILKPDFSQVTGSTFLAALGQAFFSLSLGMGCMLTYGSYLSKEENLQKNALIVTLMDTSVALFSCHSHIPSIIRIWNGTSCRAWIGIRCGTICICSNGWIRVILSVIFFVALTLAALTSSVSLLEVVTAYLIDERRMERKKATYLAGGIMVITGTLSSLSMGVLSDFNILFGVGFFDFFDILTDKIFLAIGGMVIAIFVGWFMKKEDLKDELTNSGTVEFGLFEVWYAVTKYIIPLAIGAVAVAGILSIEQTALMIFGIVLIAVLAIFSKKL